jgi:DNA-binding NarL/FixJ family response regulator
MEGDCYCLRTYREGDLEGAANVNVVTCSRIKNLVDGTDGLRYHASIPLYASNNIRLGVLNVASEDWRELSAEDLRLLYTVGDLLSIAIERARLYERSVQLGTSEERNRLAREIHDTLAQGLAAIALQLESAEAFLLDLEMPMMDGVAVLAHLSESCPEIPVIVFTAFDTDERILGAIQAGARGYLLKGAPRDQVFHAVRVVYRGESLLQPVVASKLLRQIHHSAEPRDTIGAPTRRELDVLHLLAQGLQNKEIAHALRIAERTVKFHVTSILTKLNADNRTQAVTIAVQRGLIDL